MIASAFATQGNVQERVPGPGPAGSSPPRAVQTPSRACCWVPETDAYRRPDSRPRPQRRRRPRRIHQDLQVRGRGVRVVAAQLWSIENNLSGANMDFEDFVGAVDEDGVFRGF
ncbi:MULTISPECIES: DUF6924 domain-containing protein [unclassified Streptomyces]|uniref:DUF6924 domain-containing protein n=1 Tax=unclassified Streptomyces TaxID=2593676 RepID=UPI00382D721D